jgi:hypothetical protein
MKIKLYASFANSISLNPMLYHIIKPVKRWIIIMKEMVNLNVTKSILLLEKSRKESMMRVRIIPLANLKIFLPPD